MENEDKNKDYLKFVIVEDQKRGIADIVIGIIFFCLRLVLTIFYTGSFQVHLKKITTT